MNTFYQSVNHKYIQIEPMFGLGSFSLALSEKIEPHLLDDYLIPEPFASGFHVAIEKIDTEKYRVNINEGSNMYCDLFTPLTELAPWLEDVYFMVYYENNSRYTFDQLFITEVRIQQGTIAIQDIDIYEAMPKAKKLKLKEHIGYQQLFHIPEEWLYAKKQLWLNDPAIRNYLIQKGKKLPT